MNDELQIAFNGEIIEIRHPKGYRIEPQTMGRYWDAIGEACEKYNCYRVLVEADAPQRDMSMMDAFGSGIKAAEVAITLQLALCFANYQPDELSEFFKTVAYNRGVRAEFFSDRSEALKWLGVSNIRDTDNEAA